MANETIGKLKHHCGTDADVRKDRNGKLYLQCSNCGQLKYNLPGGQDYILSGAVMFNERGEIPATKQEEKPQRNVTEKSRFEQEVSKPKKDKPVTEKKPLTSEAAYSPRSEGIGSMEL